MLGAIAGDIVGSRFEGNLRPEPGFELFHNNCRFTDDTVCSLAIADALLSEGNFAKSLRAFYHRHPRRGYGGMYRQWAETESAGAYGSWGNGAPMRAGAVGWLAKKRSEVFSLAEAQASVTHNHQDAVRGAQAVALAIFLGRNGASPKIIREQLVGEFGYDLSPETALRGGFFDISSAGTVPPAVTAALETSNWEDAVRTAVCLGGDTDTLACIAGGIAEAIHGLPRQVEEVALQYLTEDLRVVYDRFKATILE